MPRYCNPEYDALVAEMGKTASLEKRAALAKKMNDMLIAVPRHDPAHSPW